MGLNKSTGCSSGLSAIIISNNGISITQVSCNRLAPGQAHINFKALLFQLAAEIALNHHEKCDGSGYPIRRAFDETIL